MPVSTFNYFLEAFIDGDAYSAFADRRRFRTVDNQLNSMSDVIGDGRIDGWEIETGVFPNVTVTQGSGFIDKHYVNTFNDQMFELSASATFFFYAQRRVGILGTVGPKSDVVSISYVDGGPPSAPAGLSLVSPGPFTVNLSWTANTEVDLDHYDVERSLDDVIYALVGTVDEPSASFVDTVDEDTLFFYNIYAVDKTGNRSSPASDSITTDLDPALPPNPLSIEMKQSEAAINILWQRPPTLPINKVKHWKITYVELDAGGDPIPSSTKVQIVQSELYDDRIDDLVSGDVYRVTVQTVDTKDRESTGVTQDMIPQPSPAPRDPASIAFTEEDLDGAVQINLSWTSGDTPYDPATSFRHRVYVKVGEGPESLAIDVPIGETDISISLYTFDLLNYFSITYNTLITFRLTSLNESGFESFGSYIRFVTSNFSVPNTLKNLKAEFDFGTKTLIITWENNPDTDDVRITILDDDLDNPSVGEIEVVNEFIGKATTFFFVGELNRRYTVSVTPFDISDNAGATLTTVGLSFIPSGLPLAAPPTDIDVKIGDREVTLTWKESETVYASTYQLYRRIGNVSFTAGDWTLLDTMPKTILSFIDYGIENNQAHSYYITVTDIYGRQSLHLPDGMVNLNYVEATPKSQGLLTPPDNVQTSLSGTNIVLTWESLLEEFDAFTIYRSINNRHSFEQIVTLDRNALTYTDIELTLIDGTIFYYVIDKVINDADIVVQSTNVSPENSIFLGQLTLAASTFGDLVVTGRRDIKDLVDPLAEYTNTYLLPHRHREISFNDPERIDLNPELIITDWSTVDGRIFTTRELDIIGTAYIVKVDGRFPTVFFSVDPVNRRLIFSEPIVAVDDDGNVIGTIPEIEVRVLGIEETQGVLDAFRFDKIHARQIQFGTVNKPQIPDIGHEGRIREVMLPRRFLLQRFSNHTFIIPEESTDTTKTFGDGTTFFAVAESDGQIEEVVDFDLQNDGEIVAFRKPSFSPTTHFNLKQIPIEDLVSDIDDDAYQVDMGSWFPHESGLLFGRNGSGTTNDVFVRFTLSVPVGSRVTSAKMVFTSRTDASNEKARTKIRVIQPTVSDLSLPLPQDIELPGSVSWEIPAWTVDEISDNTTTPNFAELIQAFITDPGYFPGIPVILKISEELSDINAIREAWAYDGDTSKSAMLEIQYVVDLAEVDSDTGGFQSNKSYHFNFEFEDTEITRWVRITTFETDLSPNPVINLAKRLRFRVLLQSGSFYLSLGVREIDPEVDPPVGSNGGIVGPIEWVAAESVVSNTDGDIAPRGILIEADDEWQEIDIDLRKANVISFEEGNSVLSADFGVLEHLAITINPDDDAPAGPFDLFIDEIQQVNDLIVAGTSQGVQLSSDFGSSWALSRFTDTPVHKFYRATNNKFLWAITATEVLLATDPAHWFATTGTVGIQYIRDIVEDSEGNMFISTEKGVYWLEIALISTFAVWRQTQPINAFSSDAYGMYVNNLASALDEIWVSTELGIYKTTDHGDSWQDTGNSTGGFVVYQIENISTDPLLPNIIAINRKHVLRMIGMENKFKILADFEEQHKIFDLWKFAYFSGRLYISTGSGVYQNSTDDLFLSLEDSVSPPDIQFDKVLPDLDTNRFVRVAFGLDVVLINDLEEQLFIGQENRLMVANENNVLSTKKEFRTAELPSFFIDDEEVIIGYIYNHFNGVVVFREPTPVNKIVSSAHIPRRVYIAVNGGWSQTNPTTETFIFLNGFPKWLDFAIDEIAIIAAIQTMNGTLDQIPELTTFNSLFPQSQQFLDAVRVDIDTILNGGVDVDGNATTLINNTTIIQIMDDYTRLISLVTKKVATDAGLVLPVIQMRGISRGERPTGTKAEQLEIKDNFEGLNGTGLTMDVVTGSLDFRTAFANAITAEGRELFSFDKFDHMNVTIWNSNLQNTGEFTHRELEDKMEDVNSGLTSDLVAVTSSNLIKLGIFLESQNNFMFDRFNVQNIQSKFISANNNEWYDTLNSTVDYEEIISVANIEGGRFATSSHLFTDPYFANRLWVGTDNDIVQFILQGEDLVVEDLIRPGGGIRPLFVWDIFAFTDDQVYVVAADQDTGKGHLFLTTSFGVAWEELDTINLPLRFYKFGIINGNLVVTTEDGIFYNDNNFGTWFPADVVPSEQLDADSPPIAAFRQRIFNFALKTFMVVESDRWFFRSSQGIEFLALAGQLTNNGASVINDLEMFLNMTWIGTDKGLYNDGNTILGSAASFALQTDLEDNATESADLQINAIEHGDEILYCGASNGRIYRFAAPAPGEPNEWSKYQIPDFGPIHKMILHESTKDLMIVISYDKLKVVDVTFGTGVFD